MPRTIGLLLVHGIGTQGQGGCLLELGEPLIDAVIDWSGARGHPIGWDRTDLTTETDASATLTLGEGAEDVTVKVAEAWWADAFPSAKPTPVLAWGFRFITRVVGRVLVKVFRSFARAVESLGQLGRELLAAGAVVAVVVGLLYGGLLIAYAAVAILVLGGLAILIVWLVILGLLVGALLPPVRQSAIKAQCILADSVGDSYVLLRSSVRAEAMKTAVQDSLSRLEAESNEVLVLAHSQGTALAFDVLNRGKHPKVKWFVTIGTAITLLTDRKAPRSPEVLSAFLEANPQLKWQNFYARLDLVPAGSLVDGNIERLVERSVMNRASLLHEHASYTRNEVEVGSAVMQRLLEGTTAELSEGDLEALKHASERRHISGWTLIGVKVAAAVVGVAMEALLASSRSGTRLVAPVAWAIEPLSKSAADWLRGQHSEGPNTLISFALGLALAFAIMALLTSLWTRRQRDNFLNIAAGSELTRTSGMRYRLAAAATCLIACAILGLSHASAGLTWFATGEEQQRILQAGACIFGGLALALLAPVKPDPWRRSAPAPVALPPAEASKPSERDSSIAAFLLGGPIGLVLHWSLTKPETLSTTEDDDVSAQERDKS